MPASLVQIKEKGNSGGQNSSKDKEEKMVGTDEEERVVGIDEIDRMMGTGEADRMMGTDDRKRTQDVMLVCA